MTLEELDLPNRFEEVVDRPRLSRLGIFIETKGRYYLSEERLRALRDQSAIGSTSQTRGAEMVPCEYCDTLMPASSVRCPVCGAPRKSHSSALDMR
jgi:rubrerythrin